MTYSVQHYWHYLLLGGLCPSKYLTKSSALVIIIQVLLCLAYCDRMPLLSFPSRFAVSILPCHQEHLCIALQRLNQPLVVEEAKLHNQLVFNALRRPLSSWS